MFKVLKEIFCAALVAAVLMPSACAVELFNGKDLSGWYTFLAKRGRNSDPRGVFSVTNGVIRVTGEEWGSLITEEEYSDYRLTVEYRFDGTRYPSKEGCALDSGILFHSTGEDGGFCGIWMAAHEYNLIQGASGDVWGVHPKGSDMSFAADVSDVLQRGKHHVWMPGGKARTFSGNVRVARGDISADWTDAPDAPLADNERPIGEWNTAVLECRGTVARCYFNGRLVNRIYGLNPSRGRIQLQSEGCGVEFRRVTLEPLEAPHTEFTGFVGERAAELLDGRVLSSFARVDAMDEAVRAFETHEDDATVNGTRHAWWQGEYWGKTMLGHTGAWRYTGRADVRDYVRGQVGRLVDGYMRPDGYLGTYSDPKFVVRSWNLWGRKYTLWALVEAFETTGDEKALKAAEKTMDQIVSMLDGMGLSVRKTGAFNGLPTGSVLSPLVRLCRHVKKPAYLGFMKAIVADWDRADGAPPNLVANPFSGKPVHTWYPEPVIWAKSYEMMSCYEGLVDYAELTGDARVLEAAERAADLLAEHEANALGSVGYYDHFTHAAANANATIEMCDVVYWMRLCHALYRATGHVRHLDRAERAFCNSFLAGLYRGGRWGAYSVRSHGTRHGTAMMQIGMRHHCCCVDNSPRGFYDMAEHAIFRRRAVVDVNHYLPCEADVGDGLKVSVGGNYPVSEDVTLDVRTRTPVTLSLRVPGWCPSMTVDGCPVSARDGRAEITVDSDRTLALHFDMPVAIERHPCIGEPELPPGDGSDGKGHDGRLFLFELSGRYPEMKGLGRMEHAACVTRGPLVLTKTRRMGSTEDVIFGMGSVNDESDVAVRVVPRPGAGVWGAWDLVFERKNGDRQTVPVCDLPSAAPTDDWQNAFSIWH